MQNTLDEGAMARLEDHSHIDTPEVTREEVRREGSQEATNGKAAIKEWRRNNDGLASGTDPGCLEDKTGAKSGRTPHLYPYTRRLEKV